MKIAMLTTDSREHFGEYENPIPYFGTAPQGLLAGFALMADGHEIRNVKCEMRNAGGAQAQERKRGQSVDCSVDRFQGGG